jgi:hypothetical protein
VQNTGQVVVEWGYEPRNAPAAGTLLRRMAFTPNVSTDQPSDKPYAQTWVFCGCFGTYEALHGAIYRHTVLASVFVKTGAARTHQTCPVPQSATHIVCSDMQCHVPPQTTSTLSLAPKSS